MGLSKFNRYLKDYNDSAFLISSGRSFQSLITAGNKSGKLSQHTPVLHQVAMAKFNYKKQQRAITHKLSKQEL